MQIGDRVKHKISGFVGIATGVTEYMNGCRQFLVQPEKLDKDGKKMDGDWFDEQFLTIEKEGVFANPFATMAQPTVGGADRSERRTSL